MRSPGRATALPGEEETEPRQTGLRRLGENLTNCHREAKVTAPLLDSTHLPSTGASLCFQFWRANSSQSWASNCALASTVGCPSVGSVSSVMCQQHRSQNHPNHSGVVARTRRRSYLHCMGGSDGPKNIWFEPHAGKFGSRTKDRVELMLWRRVCVDKTMTLDQAKTAYLKGWTKLLPKK